jgi:hypothetical protein
MCIASSAANLGLLETWHASDPGGHRSAKLANFKMRSFFAGFS